MWKFICGFIVGVGIAIFTLSAMYPQVYEDYTNRTLLPGMLQTTINEVNDFFSGDK